MTMWVATKPVLTASGWVAAGRLVPDGDPMLEGAEDGAFVRVHDDTPAVEEAVADRPRRTTRRTV